MKKLKTILFALALATGFLTLTPNKAEADYIDCMDHMIDGYGYSVNEAYAICDALLEAFGPAY